MAASRVADITWKSSLGLQMTAGEPPEKKWIDRGPKPDRQLGGRLVVV